MITNLEVIEHLSPLRVVFRIVSFELALYRRMRNHSGRRTTLRSESMKNIRTGRRVERHGSDREQFVLRGRLLSYESKRIDTDKCVATERMATKCTKATPT